MSTVVVAPDSFKGSASAAAIAAALAEGWRSVRAADRIVLAPMADGGEGTLDAFAVAVPGAVRHPVRVDGPDGRPVEASWLELPYGSAVVELAETSGIGLLDALAPFDAHTIGFGQAIAAALDSGATRLLLAIGGSASTDAGAGALTALGARLLDAEGRPVPPGNRGLASVARVDLSGLRALPAGGAHILSDVTSPLLGPSGAAAVFGPQKGASPADVASLEEGLARFAAAVAAGAGGGGGGSVDDSAARGVGAAVDPATPGVGSLVDPATPGAGAAGGAGYGLLIWGATLSAGAAAVGEAIGLPASIASADAVLTGEGRFDSQSAAGKVPDYVSALARAAGVAAYLAAGSIAAEPTAFAASAELAALAGGSAPAIADPLPWARAAGAALARAYTAGH
ncbi:glycerate kinase [Leifsonia shinshuensis]|uniref:glycerate kinase n=1 Tax=Leifsonia shinshuensis TaxID=150026 RepID=UPI001F514DE9|nr:glycerate kinase [Leifsonia shinshuensis]MCI0157405.1 glycerate kinase [Leifsonia shinshuensis]